ncbi:hypothetical protein GCM10028804_62320 [Larkinella terrae]
MYTVFSVMYKDFEIELQNAYFESDFDKYISIRRKLRRVQYNLTTLERLG